ncbi:hypothetical protein [Mesorhizobium sp. f-mel]
MTNQQPASAGSQSHNSVVAKFGGKHINFKIDRQDLSTFEAYAGMSAYEMFSTITAGRWTVEHLKSVLKFASLPASRLKEIRQFARTLRLMGSNQVGLLDQYFKQNSPHINATLSTEPVAQYAVLALSILGGALFGISAADATFDDGVALGQ